MAEQVVGRTAEQGRSHALLELDPESVTPSVGLLQEPPALKRRLIDRIVRELVHQLAAAPRPVLTGAAGMGGAVEGRRGASRPILESDLRRAALLPRR